MSQWNELAHFLYGQGFWYADPLREIRGLSEEHLFFVPAPTALPIIWQVGHIAHREMLHIGRFLEGWPSPPDFPQYDPFGDEWVAASELRALFPSTEEVLEWTRLVRRASHDYIEGLSEDDWERPVGSPVDGLTVAHWVHITACHTALHIGRIQLLRALVEGKRERAC